MSLYGALDDPSLGINAHADDASYHGESFPAPKLTAQFVYHNVVGAAEYKAEMSWAKTILLGFLAGCYLGTGGLLAITIGGAVPSLDLGLQKLLFALVFPLGLFLVTVAGAELVTSSLALLPIGLMEGRVSIKNLLKNWSLAYIANFAGGIFLAILANNSGILDKDPWLTYAQTLAYNKCNLTFLQAITRGFMCNWLVCLAVWNSNGANDVVGKAVAIWPCIMAFVAMGFEHSVANMFFLPLGWVIGSDITAADIFLNNLLPVTLGNLLGGSIMVGLFYSLAFGRAGKSVASSFNRLTGKHD